MSWSRMTAKMKTLGFEEKTSHILVMLQLYLHVGMVREEALTDRKYLA
jgi:hypothetical protein